MGSSKVDDMHVVGYDTLVAPEDLIADLPLSASGRATVVSARDAVTRVLSGLDDRLIVVVGPCSIHDVSAAKEYGRLLSQLAHLHEADLVVIMRAYFEKPRTTIGWKGLINDPYLDNSFCINDGLRLARGLLVELVSCGVAVGCELLDTISPQYLSDLFSWGAVGARTTESQLHRELASGSSFPVGFKNGTDGGIGIAVDAVLSAAQPHHFLGVDKSGRAAIARTNGNSMGHVILRGARGEPNYGGEHVAKAKAMMCVKKVAPRIIVDCSHGNCQGDYTRQEAVAEDVARQVAQGERAIMGAMIESNIHAGAQRIAKEGMRYGVSVTDACVDMATTGRILERLAQAVQERRKSAICKDT